MFLSDLSTTTERKARKGGGTKKTKNEDGTADKGKTLSKATGAASGAAAAATAPSESKHGLRLAPVGELPIIYNNDNPNIPRETMISFFQVCAKMVVEDSNVADIVDENLSTGNGLHRISAEFQREALERNFQIEKNFGCKYMASIPMKCPDDIELLEAGKAFTLSTLYCYSKAVKLRSERMGGAVRRDGGMSRTTILEFFEACNALMALTETKELLRQEFLRLKGPPNEKIIELQRSQLTLLGLDPEYGVSQLNRIQMSFGDDQEVMMKMQQFGMCAQIACREATMDAKTKAEFYKEIPLFMHHFPHMFMFQQQMMMQQQHAQMQRAGPAGGPPGPPGGPSAAAAMHQSGMAAILATPDGQSKVAQLSEKVEQSKGRVQTVVSDLSSEQRKAYFESFGEHPLLAQLNDPAVAGDPMAKIDVFISMSDSDLDDIMKMQMIIAEDIQAGGTLVRELAASGRGKGMMSDMFALRSMSGGGAAHGHGGPHGGHQHHPGCSHYAASAAAAPDVATGKLDKMDR